MKKILTYAAVIASIFGNSYGMHNLQEGMAPKDKPTCLPPSIKQSSIINNAVFFIFMMNNLKEIMIPDSVTYIESGVFENFKNLKVITILQGWYTARPFGWSYEERGWKFLEDSRKTTHELPNGKVQEDRAFYNNRDLMDIIIPSSVTSIGSCALASCWSLTSVTISTGVTHIEGSAFSDCPSLRKIDIPGSVISIDIGAFYKCGKLTDVTLHEGLQHIGFLPLKDAINCVM